MLSFILLNVFFNNGFKVEVIIIIFGNICIYNSYVMINFYLLFSVVFIYNWGLFFWGSIVESLLEIIDIGLVKNKIVKIE